MRDRTPFPEVFNLQSRRGVAAAHIALRLNQERLLPPTVSVVHLSIDVARALEEIELLVQPSFAQLVRVAEALIGPIVVVLQRDTPEQVVRCIAKVIRLASERGIEITSFASGLAFDIREHFRPVCVDDRRAIGWALASILNDGDN